jgi:replicative DNA helicase
MLDFLNVELNPHYAGKIVICFDSWEVSSYRTPLKFISNKMKMTMDKILDWEDTLSLEAINDMKSVLETFKDERIYIRDYSHSVKEWEDSKDDIAEKYPYPEYQVVNIVDHTRLVKNEFNEREADLLTNLMKASVDSKKKNNHINIFLSQLNRNIETNANSRSDIGNTLPTASDLFGSDSVFQCSEFVIVLHRPGYYGLTEFKLTKSQVYNTGLTNPGLGDDDLLLECILKNRNGSTGLLMLKHDIKTNNFYNKPPENFQIRV